MAKNLRFLANQVKRDYENNLITDNNFRGDRSYYNEWRSYTFVNITKNKFLQLVANIIFNMDSSQFSVSNDMVELIRTELLNELPKYTTLTETDIKYCSFGYYQGTEMCQDDKYDYNGSSNRIRIYIDPNNGTKIPDAKYNIGIFWD
jgi:hypothetical protein